ncbi:FecR domain-containing protein [Botrimarina mediterranea]|uniref:FecR protein n=1 Tax=Botrimarina mediterranea TaxID=2528022 RepID=A0A518KBH8_9BACT|nr:FecR domain-containing protein [Botrimarina mediterranea]QDV75146.1 FecR protein [Botrimarina mediterranea]QDV79792.1 FecR protein [Planctomycetes bacterium K2D]
MNDELDQLIGDLFDGEIEETKRQRLNSLLRDEQGRRRYLELTKMHFSLASRAGASSQTDQTARAYRKVHDRIAPVTDSAFDRRTALEETSSAPGFRAWRGASVAAAAVVLVLGGLAVIAQRPEAPLADPVVMAASSPSEAPVTSEDVAEPVAPEVFAARIVSMSSDADWALGSGVADFLLRLQIGDELRLKRGVAKLEFASDAIAVLFGPARMKITGRGEVLLIEGRLTGRSEEGNFVVNTPNARVIDIGTAFGVVVEADETNVVVFEGEVDVQCDHEQMEAVRLTTGMSIRADKAGFDSPQQSSDPPWLDRDFRGQRPGALGPTELSLVDVVCGSAPNEYRFAGSIDPNTGTWTSLPWSERKGVRAAPATGLVSAVSGNPWVHSVFVPAPGGAAIPVDLEGVTVEAPEFSGGSWGPIWARRPFDSQADPLMSSVESDSEGFWGAGTKRALLDRSRWVRDGIVGLHANVGMTIDLDAIRKHFGVAPKAFRGVLAHLEKSHVSLPFHPEAKTSFQVFVDGELRYERLGFCRENGDVVFGADLKAGDRHLTLFATDGGDGPIYDRLVLLDPVILLAAPMAQ